MCFNKEKSSVKTVLGFHHGNISLQIQGYPRLAPNT